jgi:iron complex outermembrane receptor protein
LNANLRTEFTPKVVTDLGITFSATEKLTLLNVKLIDVLLNGISKQKMQLGQLF